MKIFAKYFLPTLPISYFQCLLSLAKKEKETTADNKEMGSFKDEIEIYANAVAYL